MMDGQYILFDDVEVFELKNGDCYIKKDNQYFFKKNYYASKRYKSNSINKATWRWFDYSCIILICISIILLINLYLKSITFINGNFVNPSSVSLSFLFLISNVVLHEIGHATFLKIWQRKVGKIKLNFRYVFPMITVDTSDSYLIPKFRRCCVSYAGVMVNIYTCYIVYVCFNNFSFVIPQVLTMITFCIIPIGGLRNDGYHILFSTILNINSTGKKRSYIDYIGGIVIYTFVIYSLYHKLLS